MAIKMNDAHEARTIPDYDDYSEVTSDEEKNENTDDPETDPLPTGLHTIVMKRAFSAIIIGITTLIVVILTKDIRALFGFVLTAYLSFLSISVVFDYKKKRIVELPVICTSSTISITRKVVSSVLLPTSARSTVVSQVRICV